jgi:hypothetical protein
MNGRKYYSPEEKVKIVLEGLRGTILIFKEGILH